MRFVWTLEKLQEEALKYKNKTEFQKKNKSACNAAYNMKIMDIICGHMPKKNIKRGENHPNFKWTLEKLQEEALKYNRRMDFQKNSDNAFQAASKRNVMDLICGHMQESATKAWSDEELFEIALKYESRGEFIKNNFDAYKSAWRRNVLDKICKHMKNSKNVSKSEKNLFEIIKTVYPKTQILRDRKVKIEGKPHIQGFDLDIYVPELRKAIEFDGKYWHSVEGLKRSRNHWPQDDLKNYSEIKDSWFASKGIQILHIKEEDWIKDNQICIDKCLFFLDESND